MTSPFLFVISFLLGQNGCTTPVQHSNLNNPDHVLSITKLPSILNKSRAIVNRFQCPIGWQRFGGSCHHLSNVSSTVSIANDICNTNIFNGSQLMYIKHMDEFNYVAHILIKNNLSELLIQIDSRLSIDRKLGAEFVLSDLSEWKKADDKFQQVRDIYHNRKMKKSRRFRLENYSKQDNSVSPIDDTQTETLITSTQSTTSTFPTDSEGFDVIRQACDKLIWNALDYDSKIFTLVVYMVSGEKYCAINDINPEISYNYICQYVLDFCFNNKECGKNGRCVNNLAGFRCSCYFWSDGQFCRKVSWKFIQMLVGLGMMILFLVFTISPLQKCQQQLMRRIIKYFDKQPTMSVSTQRSTNSTVDDMNQESISESEEKENNYIRWVWMSALMLALFTCLCLIPIISHWKSVQFEKMDPSDVTETIDRTIQLMTQCEHKSIWRIDSRIFLVISIMVCLLFFILIWINTTCVTADSNQLGGCVSPIEPFTTVNRHETAALFGIVMIEVLMTLEYYIIDLSELWNRGVLEQLRERALIPLLYSIRYYPIFISLHQRNIWVRFFACIYTLGNIGYIVIRRSSCMDFLPFSKGLSTLEQVQRHVELGAWTVIYGLIKNIPQFILLSYIGAELTIRFICSIILLCRKKRRIATEAPTTPDDGFRFHQSTSLADHPPNHNGFCSSVRKFVDDYIYSWEKDFRFSTMAICAYIISFISLYYLTCVFAFQSIVGTSSISILKFCLQQILSISELNHSIDLEILLDEIGDWSFDKEILLSAFLTMNFFAYQILNGMKTYKIHTKDLEKNNYKDIPQEENSEIHSRASESVKYLSSIFLNIVGGFFIWFHLILFVMMILSLTTFHPLKLQIDLIHPILSLFSIIASFAVLFGLKKCLTSWLSIFTSFEQSENHEIKFSKPFYTILAYLTFVFSCHIAVVYCVFRLVYGIALNLLLMPRIDYSYLGRKWEKHDRGYMTYVSHLRMEKAHRKPVKPVSIVNPVNNVVAAQEVPIPVAQNTPVPPTRSRTISDSEITHEKEEEVVDDKYYDTASDVQPEENDDTQSSISGNWLRRHIEVTDQDNELLLTGTASLTTESSRISKLLDSRDRPDQIFTPKPGHPQYISARSNQRRSEQRPFIDSTSVNSSDEEDNPPDLPAKAYRMKPIESHISHDD
ncbi:unnamed protein product [Adineta ricciae]|uniref:EGF-like domain-containing protein n=1 Tax=Adineta ricciae TaxID=249248 RepID=A0A815GX63_ADIRI|nr:unnamed protein product [Adineta ricciae]